MLERYQILSSAYLSNVLICILNIISQNRDFASIPDIIKIFQKFHSHMKNILFS